MKNFVIIVNAVKDQNLKETHRLCSYIEKKGGSCQYLLSVDVRAGIQKIQAESIPQGTECILVLGGDGTLIRAARDTVACGIPLIGINMGTLGYLCELEVSGACDAVDAIMRGEYMLEERMMLSGQKCMQNPYKMAGDGSWEAARAWADGLKIAKTGADGQGTARTKAAETGADGQGTARTKAAETGADGQEAARTKAAETGADGQEAAWPGEMKSYYALNDIVIHRMGALSLVSLTVYVNGQYLNTFEGDGVILSTPTGSTGYNMSAGGPIVDPKARLLLLTPINPHTLMPRSIVIDAQDEIVVQVGSRRAQRDEIVEVSFDGDHGFRLEVGDCIKIRRAEESVKILKFSWISFLEILCKKMQTFH